MVTPPPAKLKEEGGTADTVSDCGRRVYVLVPDNL
jgi:hypothetical protein